MHAAADPHVVETIAALEALYAKPAGASLAKETDHLTPPYRAMVEAAPFMLLATQGPNGVDCSPRGDRPGFVTVADAHTLLIPDRRGNNRIDSLRNILANPEVGLLFMIPGVNETLRIRGRAAITTDPALADAMRVDGKAPATIVRVAVERVFFQCSRALLRSGLWDQARHVERQALPSPGDMIAAATEGREGGRAYDQGLAERLAGSLY